MYRLYLRGGSIAPSLIINRQKVGGRWPLNVTHFCYSGDGIFRDISQCKMNYGSPRNAVRVSAFSSVNCSLLAGDAAGRQAVKNKLCTSAELQKAQVQLHSSSSASVWRVHLLDLLPASCKAIPFISQTLSSQRKSQYTKK